MTFESKNHARKVQRKQKRLQHMISNDSGVVCCDEPTRNLVVCNAGLSTGLDQIGIVSEFSKYGDVSNVCLLPGKSYCFVVCSNETSAFNIFNATHAKTCLGQNQTVIYLSYCANVPVQDSIPQPHPPGLMIVEDFISADEEDELINLIEWNQSEEQSNTVLKHRQVKHFGYEFRYDINNVDMNQPLLDAPIPKKCDFLFQRLHDKQIHDIFIESPHQMTVNKYEPGQGIPSHVDTHSAFADAIISLSLASDVVMDFRKPTKNNNKEYSAHVSVLLPRRSLLIMSGESRYGWKHGITPRKIDVVQNANGHLVTNFRTTRISFTFRWLSNESCKCEFHSICDTYQNQTPDKRTTPNPLENPSQCELENVHKVYDEIANHFSETRHSPWPQVNEFIQQFNAGSVLVDVGCGNGKYLQSNPSIFEIGCDRSEGLLNVCRERSFNIFRCDCLAVPLRSNSVDGCISIAVIHHLASEDRRKSAIQEMIRILRPMGRALIYVWAKNQALKSKSSYLLQNKKNHQEKSHETEMDGFEKCTISDNSIAESQKSQMSLPIHTNRTQFEHTDILVPWKLKNAKPSDKSDVCDQNSTTFLRFYHVFEEGELEEMCKQFNNVSIVKSYYDQGNWCVIFEKLNDELNVEKLAK